MHELQSNMQNLLITLQTRYKFTVIHHKEERMFTQQSH